MAARVFGKIYSTGHVRADRWYRIGRTLLYGPPSRTRRRSGRCAGWPRPRTTRCDSCRTKEWRVARPVRRRGAHAERRIHDRDGAVRGGEEPRRLGRRRRRDRRGRGARTDVSGTPASRTATSSRRTCSVKDGHLQLVDVSGLEIRPSPWRQAVDLGEHDADAGAANRTRTRCTRARSASSHPIEIAEAFACAVGLAIPTQLQARLKADERPLLAGFKELAPPREPVSIQRWNARRIATASRGRRAIPRSSRVCSWTRSARGSADPLRMTMCRPIGARDGR